MRIIRERHDATSNALYPATIEPVAWRLCGVEQRRSERVSQLSERSSADLLEKQVAKQRDAARDELLRR
jgi:hypothetical protein